MESVQLTSRPPSSAQNILLYQRLTKVLAKLTHGVEIEIQKNMDHLELRLQKAGTAVQALEPQLETLMEKLARVEDYVSYDLDHALKKSSDSINSGLHSATNLQQFLKVMIQTVLDGTSHVAVAQEKSVQLSIQNQGNMEEWSVVMAAAAATAMSLNNQIVSVSLLARNEVRIRLIILLPQELSRLDLQELSTRQQTMAEGLARLTSAADHLSSKYDDHSYALSEAKNITEDILDTLGDVIVSAAIIEEANHSYFRGFGVSGWAPYIISPVATLLLGSYGLAPSAFRNLALIALGELMGFSFAHWSSVTISWAPFATDGVVTNNATIAY